MGNTSSPLDTGVSSLWLVIAFSLVSSGESAKVSDNGVSSSLWLAIDFSMVSSGKPQFKSWSFSFRLSHSMVMHSSKPKDN